MDANGDCLVTMWGRQEDAMISDGLDSTCSWHNVYTCSCLTVVKLLQQYNYIYCLVNCLWQWVLIWADLGLVHKSSYIRSVASNVAYSVADLLQSHGAGGLPYVTFPPFVLDGLRHVTPLFGRAPTWGNGRVWRWTGCCKGRVPRPQYHVDYKNLTSTATARRYGLTHVWSSRLQFVFLKIYAGEGTTNYTIRTEQSSNLSST